MADVTRELPGILIQILLVLADRKVTCPIPANLQHEVTSFSPQMNRGLQHGSGEGVKRNRMLTNAEFFKASVHSIGEVLKRLLSLLRWRVSAFQHEVRILVLDPASRSVSFNFIGRDQVKAAAFSNLVSISQLAARLPDNNLKTHIKSLPLSN
jgi:hypothetical protein